MTIALPFFVGAASGLVALSVGLRVSDRETWWKALIVIIAINVAYQVGRAAA